MASPDPVAAGRPSPFSIGLERGTQPVTSALFHLSVHARARKDQSRLDPTTVTDPPETLDIRGAARRLRITYRQLLDLVDRGALPAHMHDQELRFKVEDLDAYRG